MRLIDADAIRKKYKHELSRTYLDDYAKGFQAGLNAATGEHVPIIDAVAVVRCKDCKHSKPWYRDKYRCFLWAETGIDVFEDGFCSYGERKGGEE